MPVPDRLEVGRVVRAHGLRGEVMVTLVTDRAERVAARSELWVGDRRLVVVSARPHQQRWLVTFEGVSGRSAAEALAGQILLAEPMDDPDAIWVHEVIGTVVVERDGTERGRVTAVVGNPAHDLLELESGALVPMVFVVGSADGVTTIDPPEGLFGAD